MKHKHYEKTLLNHKIVDHRNLYSFVVKRRFMFPSLRIMVMGLYKNHLVFYKISTSYRLIKFIDKINIEDIQNINIIDRKKEMKVDLFINNKKSKYLALEHKEDIYLIKKEIEKLSGVK